MDAEFDDERLDRLETDAAFTAGFDESQSKGSERLCKPSARLWMNETFTR